MNQTKVYTIATIDLKSERKKWHDSFRIESPECWIRVGEDWGKFVEKSMGLVYETPE